MIKTEKEKEDAIDKLKSELKVKKRKIEEDKSAQESRSDPESVISSLTSDTNGTQRHSWSNANKKQKLAQPQDHSKSLHHMSSHNMSSVSTTEESSGGGEDRTSSRSGTGSGSGDPSAQGFSVDKTDATGVSDITDSKSNTSGSGSGNGSGNTESVTRDECQPSTSTISSDAAVASVKSSLGHPVGEHQHSHKDVVVNHAKRSHRKRPPQEVSSIERNVGVDYEEIFTMSNIPQIIATTSGKIVRWNQCFLKATGIRRSEVERMTIFSLVKPEKLSNFFEIVSLALKEETLSTPDDDNNNNEVESDGTTGDFVEEVDSGKNESEQASADTSRRANYAAMTLPCVDFPAMKKRWEKDPLNREDNLHVTVSFCLLVLQEKQTSC